MEDTPLDWFINSILKRCLLLVFSNDEKRSRHLLAGVMARARGAIYRALALVPVRDRADR